MAAINIYRPTEALSLCLVSERYYRSDTFPKTCNTCLKTYFDRQQFLSETEKLTKGSYSRGTKGKIFEYRNCTCGSTLVCVMESRRDESPAGLKAREDIGNKINFLVSNGIDRDRARRIVLDKKKK